MAIKTLNRSFAAGEISPQLFSRIDLDKFQTGVALCLNCETLPQGPIQNRPGFQYILEAKYSDKNTVLLPFSYSTQQTFALEFGDLYIRFHTNGGTLLEPSVSITGVTNAADPVFTTATAHGYAIGEWLQVVVPTMPRLNGRWVKVSAVPSTTTFRVIDLFGAMISTVSEPVFSGTATVARVFEIATPYSHLDLHGLHIVQSADVLTIVHTGYEPRELRRLSATSWSLDVINFASTLSPPRSTGAPPSAINHSYRVVGVAPTNGGYSGVSNTVVLSNDLTIPGYFNIVTWSNIPGGIMYFIYKLDVPSGQWGLIGTAPSGANFIDDGSKANDLSAPQYLGLAAAPVASGSAQAPIGTGVQVTPTGAGVTSYTYVVTSLSEDASEESLASAEVSTTNDLTTTGNVNTVRWPAVPGVRLYNVYRKVSGIFGLVGRAGTDCTFVDNNIAPNTALTPPIQPNPFLGAGNYPRSVSYYQQRRVFGGTVNLPQTVWMTRSGTEKNLGYSFPTRDDDGVTFRVVSREANTIRHMVPMNELILLTSGGEWQCAAADGGALTPSNISVQQQGYSGASDVQPVVTDRTILFAQDRGGAIRELQFSWQQQGYQTSNVSILAPHLFDYRTVVQLAFTRSPTPSLWSLRSDGVILGMTYVPEHEVRAWHQHNTLGTFESICAIAEGDEDVLYVVVHRFVLGRHVRYIERKHTRKFEDPADQFFVDSGLSYAGVAVTEFSGLYHLEGEMVSILADAGVIPAQKVIGGKVALDAPATKVHVGLPYISKVQTLPLAIQTQAFGQGTTKNVNKVHMRVLSSSGFKAGPSFERLRTYPTRAFESYGSPPGLVTGEVPITLDPMWQRDGSVCIQQDQPTALTLLGMALEVATGN